MDFPRAVCYHRGHERQTAPDSLRRFGLQTDPHAHCEMAHLPQFVACPELELSHGNCDFFLFPERTYYGDVPHSYIVEFKHVK